MNLEIECALRSDIDSCRFVTSSLSAAGQK
jgi:hypothetical protein